MKITINKTIIYEVFSVLIWIKLLLFGQNSTRKLLFCFDDSFLLMTSQVTPSISRWLGWGGFGLAISRCIFSQCTKSMKRFKYVQLNRLLFKSRTTNSDSSDLVTQCNSVNWFSFNKSDRRFWRSGNSTLKFSSFSWFLDKSSEIKLCWCKNVPIWMLVIFACLKFKWIKFDRFENVPACKSPKAFNDKSNINKLGMEMDRKSRCLTWFCVKFNVFRLFAPSKANASIRCMLFMEKSILLTLTASLKTFAGISVSRLFDAFNVVNRLAPFNVFTSNVSNSKSVILNVCRCSNSKPYFLWIWANRQFLKLIVPTLDFR